MEVARMKAKQQKYEFKGDRQPLHTGEIQSEREYFPYIADPSLKRAVNLAIALNRPLLIEGESGCGKTRLADAIAYEFSKKYPEDCGEWWCYHVWNVKSTSRAEDGLYWLSSIWELMNKLL
jgi:MoxR-like ATPase